MTPRKKPAKARRPTRLPRPANRNTIRKYKVFRAHLGFYDIILAAPSRKAALEAWGVTQDLFKDGRAQEIDDLKLSKIALEKPFVPFRRLFGSKGKFEPAP